MTEIIGTHMRANGQLVHSKMSISEWLSALKFMPNNTVVYPATKPSGMSWDLYYTLRDIVDIVGGNIELMRDIDMDDVMSRLLKSDYGKKFVPDESFPSDDWFLENGANVDLGGDEFVTQAATHGWVGFKPGGQGADIAPLLVRFVSRDVFVVCDVESAKVKDCAEAQLVLELSKLAEQVEVVGQPKAPTLGVKLRPIFEVVGKIKLKNVILATNKDDKLGQLRQTVANLGLQPRGKTAGDLANAIQETLHEIADKHQIGDVMIAHESSEPLGAVVKIARDADDAFDRSEQISVLARESGGIVMPSTPLLSRVKDMVLIKPTH